MRREARGESGIMGCDIIHNHTPAVFCELHTCKAHCLKT